MFIYSFIFYFFFCAVANDGSCFALSSRGHVALLTHLVGLRIVEEIGPVWVRLHEPELKELPEAQLEDVEGDLEGDAQPRVYAMPAVCAADSCLLHYVTITFTYRTFS